jgi:hypothetical protein
MEDFMLGPALKALFVDLHHRGRLTEYETEIHRELLRILLTDQFATRVGAGAGPLVGSAAAGTTSDMKSVQVSEDHLNSLGVSGGIGGIFGGGPTFSLQVDLSGGTWSGERDLQSDCPDPDCELKKKAR